MGITAGILGGLLMNIGAYFTFKGDIFKSIMCYLVADCMWMWLSYNSGDNIGTLLIGVGMAFGLGAYYKMHTGKLRKDLKV